MSEESKRKQRETMIAKYGSEQAWKEHMRRIAIKGGENGKGHKFAHGKVDPKEAGKLGLGNRYEGKGR